MSLLNQIAEVSHPAKFGMIPDTRRNLYTFCKTGVPMNKAELEKAEIETVIANSFDQCFRERPDLVTWFLVSVTP